MGFVVTKIVVVLLPAVSDDEAWLVFNVAEPFSVGRMVVVEEGVLVKSLPSIASFDVAALVASDFIVLRTVVVVVVDGIFVVVVDGVVAEFVDGIVAAVIGGVIELALAFLEGSVVFVETFSVEIVVGESIGCVTGSNDGTSRSSCFSVDDIIDSVEVISGNPVVVKSIC